MTHTQAIETITDVLKDVGFQVYHPKEFRDARARGRNFSRDFTAIFMIPEEEPRSQGDTREASLFVGVIVPQRYDNWKSINSLRDKDDNGSLHKIIESRTAEIIELEAEVLSYRKPQGGEPGFIDLIFTIGMRWSVKGGKKPSDSIPVEFQGGDEVEAKQS